MPPPMQHAGDILKLSGSYWACFSLHAGMALDVFSHLAEGARPAADLARAVGADQRGLETLLNALCAQGLLSKAGDSFANTELSQRHLVRGRDGYLGHIITHHRRLVPQWHQLDRAVRSGTPTRPERNDAADAEAGREAFLMGMHNLVMQLAPKAAGEIDLSGREHLLDLGGGPGTWAIHFCKANPDLKATVFDLPTTRTYAEDNIARFGMTARVDFLGGDFLQEEIGGAYDVVWMSQILHSAGPDDCRLIIGKAARALSPGGLLMIHEFLLDDDKTGPLFPALFSLNMLTGSAEGRSYSRGELEEMMVAAGVGDIRVLPFRAPNDSRVLAGKV